MDKKEQIKLSESIYNTCRVLNNYCQNNLEYEEIQNISPIVDYLSKQADYLYVGLNSGIK